MECNDVNHFETTYGRDVLVEVKQENIDVLNKSVEKDGSQDIIHNVK